MLITAGPTQEAVDPVRFLTHLIAALQTTRTALVGEGDEFDRRRRMLEEDRGTGS